jgi:hypothetical protein
MEKIITLSVSINMSFVGKVRRKIYIPELDSIGSGPVTMIMSVDNIGNQLNQ